MFESSSVSGRNAKNDGSSDTAAHFVIPSGSVVLLPKDKDRLGDPAGKGRLVLSSDILGLRAGGKLVLNRDAVIHI